MPSTHPLELAEILLLVAAYFAWYQACIPLIWRDIDLRKLPRSTALIQRHSHLVKKVEISQEYEYTALRFSNLESIHLLSAYQVRSNDIAQFIMNHPTTTCLEMRNLSTKCDPAFWEALLGFCNLRTLAMSIFGTNLDKFWPFCTRLERLDINMIDIPLPPGEYPNLKHLSVDAVVPFFMGFLQKCPHLTSIGWRAAPSQEARFVSGLSELLEANALPNLECLMTGTKEISNEVFTRLIQSLPLRINTLSIGFSRIVLNMDFATLFRPHFSNLRDLEALADANIKSPFAQLVMSSCPLLEKLTAPHVDALVVTEGGPWVLKVLNLTFCFDPPSTPLVFDRLSKLTRLEELRMLGPRKQYNIVELTIEYGLHKLSTLRLLRSITHRPMVERMGDTEVDWMLEHWKSLTVFDGDLNTHDPALRGALQRRMKKHGIKVRY
ncbi:MAG: LOW QUALITY PROTEIN: hypothetical protein J3Q66DRAFT_331240 [Benniella sp.]|nr:MAG: LOW QUALITY PROTEIN: hypothetical protein J3Q66DRAFT_331240 [Benniella sp.]